MQLPTRAARPCARRAGATGLGLEERNPVQSLTTLVHGSAPGARTSPGRLVLGRYRPLERLGAGGFGVVWSAWDEQLGREVALKRIALGGAHSGDRVAREAVVTARLAHAAIVAIYEARAEADAFYLVSELVRGCTLAELCAERVASDAQLLAIGVDLSDALAHAHARGIIHRDVKPQNVLVPALPGPVAAKLCDFGGAHLVGEEALTRSGDVIGTLAYMAPEQADGGPVGQATDVYALALVLYEALSGVHPVLGLTPAATARRLGQRQPPLRRYRPDLPTTLCHVLDVALSPRPADRAELADVLAELSHARASRALGPGSATSPRTRLCNPEQARTRVGPNPPARRAAAHGGDQVPAFRPAAPPQDTDTAGDYPAAQGSPPARAGRSIPPGPRLLGALGAGALVALALSAAGGPGMSAAARVVPAGAALTVALLPRLGWLACLGSVVLWLAVRGHAGLAVVVCAAALPSPALLRRGGPLWSAPALAVACGLAGLAGAYPALAGQAHGWVRRAVLGGLGFWWLSLAEAARGTRVWLGAPAPILPAPAWDSSPVAAAVHVLAPVLDVSVLAGAGVWAAAAMALPWLVRGRRFGLDVAGALGWASATVLVTRALPGPLGGPADLSWPRGLLVGAVLGAALAVGARGLRGAS